MINIFRSPNEPPELTHQRGLSSGRYNTEPIRQEIAITFLDKCYLCEKDHGNFNIEHLKPHRGDHFLMFDWNNLFYCCRNCNSIKSIRYDDIVDCCDHAIIITEEIDFEVDNSDIENIRVNITSANPANSIIKTVDLINLCYIGTTYDTKTVAFETKKDLFREMNRLKELIYEFIQYINPGNQPRATDKMQDIQRVLNKRRPFLAFKITYIKNNPKLMKHFSALLPKFP